MSINYQNFDVAIEASGEGYVTQVISSPGGEASSPFTVPLSPLELENFRLKVERSRKRVRRIESREMELIKDHGGRLFEAVFNGNVKVCFRRSLDEVDRNDNGGLRIRIRLAGAPELVELPWEYLYDASRNHFLSLSATTPIVRYLDIGERIRALEVDPPIRILGMLSSPPEYEELDVEDEWRKLEEAIEDLRVRGVVVLERVEAPTLQALRWQLRAKDYHVFHFIGHGGYDQHRRDGVLVLEDAQRRAREVSAQVVGAVLRNERTLRLVVLNACEGGRTIGSDLFSGSAQTLVQQGIPAVVAMQFEISDEAAITFTHEFYKAIGDGYPVDAALGEARLAIYTQGNETEWGTPVLYMRSPDGELFDLKAVRRPVNPASERIQGLRKEAEQALAARSWSKATDTLRALLVLEPRHEWATVQLRETEARLAFERGLEEAQRHRSAGRLDEALATLQSLSQPAGNQTDVQVLIREIEAELVANRRREEEKRDIIRLVPAQDDGPQKRQQNKYSTKRIVTGIVGGLIGLSIALYIVDNPSSDGLYSTTQQTFDPGYLGGSSKEDPYLDPGYNDSPGYDTPPSYDTPPTYDTPLQPSDRLADYAELLTSSSYIPAYPATHQALWTEGYHSYTLTFQQGVEYLAVGFCDQNCGNLDIAVIDAAGTLIAQDDMYDSVAEVSFVPYVWGYYNVVVTMSECKSSTCSYSAQVFLNNGSAYYPAVPAY
jgi:hypothetical protein